ncbi:MarR family winged helix-turn-helix transcriptional regulator [Bacillus sp. M6-12]|uniref:MarR family winged helix-turn-helix transcriptional regulator n=1 Tax=Bacillus sp. M6-12 TaxID=2054166 RepID=UPI0015E14587|nr:MarR family transcriptional regulator [Bacillus sp. M6-12]
MNEITSYVKEAFALLEKVNSSIVKEHESLFSHDLTPKQMLLLQIVRDEKEVTVNQLSEKLAFSPSSVSQILGRLENDQYVKRSINAQNRREVLVALDKKGTKLFKEYDRVDNLIIEKYYSHFSLDEVIQFRDLVSKLYQVIQLKRSEGEESER